jgi:hypothetical protein
MLADYEFSHSPENCACKEYFVRNHADVHILHLTIACGPTKLYSSNLALIYCILLEVVSGASAFVGMPIRSAL